MNHQFHLQIEDILETIDINNISTHSYSTRKQNQRQPYSSSPTKIENFEMPLPSPTINNHKNMVTIMNNKRKRMTFCKMTVIILLLIGFIALLPFYESNSLNNNNENDKSSFESVLFGNRASSTINSSNNGKNNEKQNDHTKIVHHEKNKLPNYASIQENNNKKSKKNSKSSVHKKDTKVNTSTISSSSSSSYVNLSAAEKLQCPTSVRNFIINATDAKDECDGLRKAFDKTCGGGGSSSSSDNEEEEEEEEEALDARRFSRRRLSSSFDTYDVEYEKIVLPGEDSKWMVLLKSFVDQFMPFKNIQKRRRRLEEMDNEGEGEMSVEDDDVETETTKTATTTEEKKEVKHLSPTLPTSSGHMTDKMAEDALGLNSELSDIAEAIKELGNSTKSSSGNVEGGTSTSKYTTSQHGTDESGKTEAKKDLTSTAVAVSVIMNNPDVIELQSCCRSILQVFHDECDSPDDEEYADRRLFVIVCVIGLCGMIKSLIRHFKIRWLPEAGGCILVGVVGGLFLKLLPNIDFGFSHDMFLRVMVPPIVFEAALNIDKKSFRQMLIPIVILALFGTIMSSILTAAIVFYGTSSIKGCTSIPFIESLTFGALISSIDPIAVLSVLSNMGMSDKDQIYVIIFGESLLNDGVAIVLFQTLLNFMDANLVIDSEAVYLATLQFLVIAFGSLFVGLASGLSATLYFWLMQGMQTPLVEVIMFICWAFIPYYVCDGIEWSGIVAIVAVGFFMDIYIIGHKNDSNESSIVDKNSPGAIGGTPGKKRPVRYSMFSKEGFLSAKAKNHIRFVTEINSTLMETAIFSYLGIFLFNKRYHWNFWIPTVAIFSCLCSRTLTVWFFSFISNMINRVGSLSSHRINKACGNSNSHNHNSSNNNHNDDKPQQVIIDARMQTVLIFAGLRGAMSFALVETVPMFDESTGQGSRFKPELKAMTSACIVFTVFVMGGYTDYLLEKVGMKPSSSRSNDVEMVSLINNNSDERDIDSSDQWESTGERMWWQHCIS